MFGRLIDSPPAHYDTVLSTFIYMQNSLKDMGMKFVHISIDMQLFAIAKQICWNQKEKFQCVVLHPGGMHIIQSFIGCIGTLMKGQGIEPYVESAYGGLKGIPMGSHGLRHCVPFVVLLLLS